MVKLPEGEYGFILDSIKPKFLFKHSKSYGISLIKKAMKDVASHRYRELKEEIKSFMELGTKQNSFTNIQRWVHGTMTLGKL